MEFTERYKTYNNTELLRITRNPETYQAKAVETAQKILSERQLTQDELNVAEVALKKERLEKERKEQQKRALAQKWKEIGKKMLANLHPIKKEPPTTRNIINTISLLLAVYFLYQLYLESGLISFMFTDRSANWDLSMVFYFLPLLVLLSATILFFKRIKLGWLLIAVFFTYSAVSAVALFIITIWTKERGIPDLLTTVPSSSPHQYIIALLLFAGCIWLVGKENIRRVYGISKQTMIITISITAVIISIVIVSLY